MNVSVFILNSNISFSSAPDKLIMNDAQYTSFKRGSRAVMSSWMTYTTLIWVLKACWLFIFSTLTYVQAYYSLKSYANGHSLGFRRQVIVKIFACVVALSYVVVIVMIMVHCIPSNINWHVQQLPSGQHQVIHGPLYVRWTVMNYIVVASANCG